MSSIERVIFCVGASSDNQTADEWRKQFETVGIRGDALLVLDQHYPLMDIPPETLDALIAQARAFIDAGGDKQTVLLGHSLGGLILLKAGRAVSSKVEALITMGSPHRQATYDTGALPFERPPFRMLALGGDQDQTTRRISTPDFADETAEVASDHMGFVEKPDVIKAVWAKVEQFVNGVLLGRKETLTKIAAELDDVRSEVLKPFDEIWQPSQFTPDFTNLEQAFADVAALQAECAQISDDAIALLVGNTLTEDGLPLFMSRLYTMYGIPTEHQTGDVYGADNGLVRFFHQWTAEEDRHGRLLDTVIEYSARVIKEKYERLRSNFLYDGMDIQTGNDPYKIFFYTSFQELATQVSHTNLAKLINRQVEGKSQVVKLCGMIAADEGRHAEAYMRFIELIFREDPDRMMIAMADMMKTGILMPAHNMRESLKQEPGTTYKNFEALAQSMGMYTQADYADISAKLIERWDIEHRALQTQAGEAARAYILKRQGTIQKIAERKPRNMDKEASYEFDWVIAQQSL
ncbi:MAG TPA: acyl-ACP desaturase [Candidatus Gracilibacteria bacterium]